MTIVKAASQYQKLSADQVIEALNDPNPNNPIAIEISRLIEGYTFNFNEHVKKLGYMPAQILRSKGSCAIEEIAMKLVADTIRDELKKP